jgi:hypothetical protein
MVGAATSCNDATAGRNGKMGAYFRETCLCFSSCRASANVGAVARTPRWCSNIPSETSKRGTTHQRQKIKQKVRETHKKSKKEAKRNPQWKTSARFNNNLDLVLTTHIRTSQRPWHSKQLPVQGPNSCRGCRTETKGACSLHAAAAVVLNHKHRRPRRKRPSVRRRRNLPELRPRRPSTPA